MSFEKSKSIGGDDIVPVPVFLAVSLGEAAAVVAQEIYFRMCCQIKGAADVADVVKVSSAEIQHKLRWLSPTSVRDALRLLVAAGILIVVSGGGSSASSYKLDDARAKFFAQHPEEGAALRAGMKAKKTTTKTAQKISEQNPLANAPSEIRSLVSENRSVDSENRSLPSEIRSQTESHLYNKKENNKNLKPAPMADATCSEPQSHAEPRRAARTTDRSEDVLNQAKGRFLRVWETATGTPYSRDLAHEEKREVWTVWENTQAHFLANQLDGNALIEIIRTERNKYRHRDVAAQNQDKQESSATGPMTKPIRHGNPVQMKNVPPSDKHGNKIPEVIRRGFNADDMARYVAGEYFENQGTGPDGRPAWSWSKDPPKAVGRHDVMITMKNMRVSKKTACMMLNIDPNRADIADIADAA